MQTNMYWQKADQRLFEDEGRRQGETGGRYYKGAEETLPGEGYVHFLGCGEDFISVYIC